MIALAQDQHIETTTKRVRRATGCRPHGGDERAPCRFEVPAGNATTTVAVTTVVTTAATAAATTAPPTTTGAETTTAAATTCVLGSADSTPVFRTYILHLYGFDSIRILFERGEIPQNTGNTQEFRPELH